MLTPNDQQARLFLAHPSLPLRISLDVCAVVVEQIALNLRLTWLAQEGKLICPQVRVVALDVRIIANVARARGGEREQVCSELALVGGAIFPELPPRIPVRTQTFIVSDGILNNERFDAFRMRKRHAKTNRAAIVLHVKRVARKTQCFSEMSDDLSEVIEGVSEVLRIWPVTVSEARIIRRDEMIAV